MSHSVTWLHWKQIYTSVLCLPLLPTGDHHNAVSLLHLEIYFLKTFVCNKGTFNYFSFLPLLVIKKLILRTTCQLWAVRN